MEGEASIRARQPGWVSPIAAIAAYGRVPSGYLPPAKEERLGLLRVEPGFGRIVEAALSPSP